MTNLELPPYAYGGARALVLLHEERLRRFVETWRRAKERAIALPATEDPAYVSLEALLRHVLSSAGGYMTWSCEVLGLPDPGMPPPPEVDRVEHELGSHVDALLERWRTPLAEVDEERFYRPTHASRWHVEYCVDAMLEHAVMHPIRHEHQLRTLMGEGTVG